MSGRAIATGTGCGLGHAGRARSSLLSPRCSPGRTSRRCPAGGPKHALLAVVQGAYVDGVSTRKVDEIMKALGLNGVSKSEVARICGELDPASKRFGRGRSRLSIPTCGGCRVPHGARQNGRVTSQATVVAVGVTSEGERQDLGSDVGPSADSAFWTAFLRSLKRGLRGVRLVTSDAHKGLKQANRDGVERGHWQRCRVHFMRNSAGDRPEGGPAKRLPPWSAPFSRSRVTRRR